MEDYRNRLWLLLQRQLQQQEQKRRQATMPPPWKWTKTLVGSGIRKQSSTCPRYQCSTTRRWFRVPVRSTIGPSLSRPSAHGLHCWMTSTLSSFTGRVSQMRLCDRMLWRKAQLRGAQGSTTCSNRALVRSREPLMLFVKQSNSRWVQRVGMKPSEGSTKNSGYSPGWKQVQSESLC